MARRPVAVLRHRHSLLPQQRLFSGAFVEERIDWNRSEAALEKIGGVGAVIAAPPARSAFPKLALIGALFGLGAVGAYESQIFIGVQS